MSATAIALPPHERTVLDSGLTVLVLRRPRLPLVAVRLATWGGAVAEPPDRPRVSALAARLATCGAAERDERRFAEDLDFIAGHLSAAAGREVFVLDGEFTTSTLDLGLELWTQSLLEPRFDEAVVERERQRGIAEIIQDRDEPDAVADEAFMKFLFEGHAFGRTAAGSVAGLRALGRDDLVRFHAERVGPRGAVLVVAGDVDPPAMLARLEGLLSGWTTAREAEPWDEPAPVRGRRVVLVDVPGATQVQYRTGNVGVARKIPDWHALLVGNAVLGGGFTSRLVDEVRVRRGLTYGVHSRFLAGRLPGPFAVSTFTQSERLGELDEVIRSILEQFRREGPTPDEVAAAKAYLIGTHPRRLETNEGLANAVAEAELFELGLQSIPGFCREIEETDRDAVADAMSRALPVDDRLTVLAGDARRIREDAERIGELEVVSVEHAEPPPATDPTRT